MSDYLTDLRRDLVDAHDRYGGRSAMERAARAHTPTRAGLAALAAAAAVVIAVVLGGVALTRGTDDQVVGRRAPAVIARVALGDDPAGVSVGGVASGFGAAWITGRSGEIIRVDAATHKVTARIPVAGSGSRQSGGSGGIVSGMAVQAGAVWATVFDFDSNQTSLVRVNPATNRVTARIPLGARTSAYISNVIAPLLAGGGALWVAGPHGGVRIDPRRGVVTDLVSWGLGDIEATSYGSAGNDLWIRAADGRLVWLDARSGVRHATFPATAGGTARLAVIPDGGVIVGHDDGTLARINASTGKALWSARVGDIVGPMTVTGDRLWAVNRAGRTERVTAVSLATGRIVSSLALDATLGTPQTDYALATVGDRLWIATPAGNAVIVSP